MVRYEKNVLQFEVIKDSTATLQDSVNIFQLIRLPYQSSENFKPPRMDWKSSPVPFGQN